MAKYHTQIQPFFVLLIASFVVTSALLSSTANACGRGSDCKIGERTYRISMPKKSSSDKPIGALIFNHGYRGTAAGVMKNKGFVRAIRALGIALVAPKSLRADWDIPNAPSKIGVRSMGTETEFFKALKKDLVSKHNIDPDKIVVSGFSAGGMVTWELACKLGDTFAAYVPISGTFWAPVPTSCSAMPVDLIQIHGTKDTVVPIKGRPIGPGRQGNVETALAMAKSSGDFGDWKQLKPKAGLSCQETRSSEKKFIRFCTHSKGHSFRSRWLVDAWNLFEKSGALR